MFVGKWKISVAFVRNDPIEKASVNTRATGKHTCSLTCFLWGPDAHGSARERKRFGKKSGGPWERKYNALALPWQFFYPFCAPKAGWNRARTSGEPSGLVNTLIRYCFKGKQGGERKSAHSQLFTRTAWRFLRGSVVFSLPVPDHHRFTTVHTSLLWIMCFGFE